MAFYFQPQGSWSSLNKKACDLFAAADIRVYAGAAHALLEFTLGFREQFPLKKKYFYFKDLDPHFALAATALAKAGLQMTALDMSAVLDSSGVADSAKIAALVEGFDREFGFIFFPIDNPVTGKLYPFAELQQALAAKSLPRLQASYGQHRLSGMRTALDRNEAVMYNFAGNSFGDGTTLAASAAVSLLVLGERMRFGSPVASALSPVTVTDLQNAKKDFAREAAERTVLAFEAKNCGGAQSIFAASDAARLFDRSVVCFEDMDGYAFLTALAERLGEPLKPPGQDWRFETTSLSRWGGIRTMDWLKTSGVAGQGLAQGLKPEQIRGLVTIDARLLSDANFEKHFMDARAEVLKAQLGS